MNACSMFFNEHLTTFYLPSVPPNFKGPMRLFRCLIRDYPHLSPVLIPSPLTFTQDQHGPILSLREN